MRAFSRAPTAMSSSAETHSILATPYADAPHIVHRTLIVPRQIGPAPSRSGAAERESLLKRRSGGRGLALLHIIPSSSQSTTPRRLIRARGPRSALGGLAPGPGMGLLRDNIVLAGRGASSVFSAPASASTPCGRLLLAPAGALRGASVLALGQNVSQASVSFLRCFVSGGPRTVTSGLLPLDHARLCTRDGAPLRWVLCGDERRALEWRIAPSSRCSVH